MAQHVECRSCGNAVTNAFGRVFGDEDNIPHACPGCATQRELQNCAATSADADGTLTVSVRSDETVAAVFRSKDEDREEAVREAPGPVFVEEPTSAQDPATPAASAGDSTDEKFAALVSD